MAAPTEKELALAEFKSLRDEIHVRIQQQQLLITLTVTALGALGTVAVGTKSYDILLLVPLITTTFGLMFLEHARVIGSIGDYIREELGHRGRPTAHLGRWERSDHRARSEHGTKAVLQVVPTLILFFISPAVAAIVVLDSADAGSAESWIAWAGLASVVALLILVLVRVWDRAKERKPRGVR